MFIVNSYALAVVFCIVTMLCWGSWGNTQKLASKNWRYELYYWDYVIGMLLFSLLIGFTLGSHGEGGRPFLEDLRQADASGIGSVLLGGVVFNASNILLSASISLAGLAVAFPLGVGLALVLGVIINYIGAPKGDPVILFLGVALIVAAIVFNGVASGLQQKGNETNRSHSRKGIVLAALAGVIMAFFLPLRGGGHGPEQLRGAHAGYDDALHGAVRLLVRRGAEQLRVQHLCDAPAVRGRSGHL